MRWPASMRQLLYALSESPLFRTVHPKQQEMVEQLCARDQKWSGVRDQLTRQREVRARLYDHVCVLNCDYSREPDSFVFPDPYSLLLWIWTFQLFDRSYCVGPGDSWSKFYYRGESRNYRATQFCPTMARGEGLKLDTALPARLRHAIVRHLSKHTTDKTARARLSMMSCSQALAVGQHYKISTPLLDVTTNPEVAVCFATDGPADDDLKAFIGYLHIDAHNSPRIRDLALVVPPHRCKRLYAQSGFFVTVPHDKLGGENPFQLVKGFALDCQGLRP